MNYKKIYTLISILAFSFCKSPIENNSNTDFLKEASNESLQISSLPFLDSSITLSNVKDIDIRNEEVTEKEAKDCLFKYFKPKGAMDRNIIKASAVNEDDKLCIDYDTIYQIHTTRFSGAVISYWLGACDLNGHCFQSAKSIILSTPNGMEIISEGFISSNFTIDSIVGSDIYGYEYDCGGKGIIRRFKLSLK